MAHAPLLDAGRYSGIYANLAESLTKGEIGFLIGAGMSIDSGIESGTRLARRMLRAAVLGAGHETDTSSATVEDLAGRYPFEAIAHLLARRQNVTDIARWLRDKAGFNAAVPKDAHKRFHELRLLLGRRFPSLIFTTNFDVLIETQFAEDALCITSENLEDLREARQKGQVAVIHLHGAIKYPKSLIYGEGEQAQLEGPLVDLFRSSLATEVFVLIGYSLTDTNLRDVFFDILRVADTRRGLKKKTFAISPAVGDPGDISSEAGLARNIWEQRQVEHLPVNASQFFGDLLSATDDFVSFRVKQEVAGALKVDQATLDSMLKSAVAPFGVLEPNDLLLYLYYALVP